MKTGRLLDVLGGHEGPVHGLMFSPTNVSHNIFYFNLLSVEWYRGLCNECANRMCWISACQGRPNISIDSIV